MKAASARQPKESDPQEQSIKKSLESTILRTEFARKFIIKATRKQDIFFNNALLNIDDAAGTRNEYLKLLNDLSRESNSHVTSGIDFLSSVNKKGLIIITNHLGIVKLTKVQGFEPFPLRHASIFPIVQSLRMSIHESAIELPDDLLKVQQNCEVVVVRAGGNNRTTKLIDDSKMLINSKKSAIIMYPEGGTTGKRNNGGPYDLDAFHSGAFIVAKELGISVLPVCQYFNPNSGFEIDILKPIGDDDFKKKDISIIIENAKKEMQAILSKK